MTFTVFVQVVFFQCLHWIGWRIIYSGHTLSAEQHPGYIHQIEELEFRAEAEIEIPY